MDEFSSVLYLFRTFLLIFPISLLFYYWYTKQEPFRSAVNKLPGPYPWPIIGNAYDLAKTPEEIFKQFPKDLEDFGPVFRFWALMEPIVVLMRARDYEVILQGMTHHVKGSSYEFLHPWLGQGLLTSKGAMWRIHRKVLTPAFHFNILHEFLPIFNKNAVKLCQRLSTEVNAPQGFNMFHYSSLCSLDIICESAMGTTINAQDDSRSPYVQAVIKVTDLIIRRFTHAWLRIDWIYNLSPTKREMDKNIKYVDNFTDKVIADRRKYLKTIDTLNLSEEKNKEFGERRSLAFLDLLLAAEEEGSEHMTQKDIRDQVSTFMFEGHDTVSTAMCWALFLIGTHPQHQERIVEELNEVFGESGRAPDMSDLANLKYLERCIKESMRLYPSVAFIERKLFEDAKLEKHTVPAGCTIALNIYMLHRDPEFWPEPEKFDPDRFLPENVKGRHPYAYIPFSAGPRNCIGQKFALLEEKSVVSTVLRRFRVEAAHDIAEAQLQIGLVLRPKNGLKIRLYDRNSHPKLRIQEDRV